MIPIRDTAPSRYPAIMMWVLIGINVVVFVFEASLGEAGIEQLFNQYGAPSGSPTPAHGSLPAAGSQTAQRDVSSVASALHRRGRNPLEEHSWSGA